MDKYPLLIEIGCEDLPPQDVCRIDREAAGVFSVILKTRRIGHGKIEAFSSPRRIALSLTDISSHQDPAVEKVKGPPRDIAVKDGKPTPAGLGFARKMGVDFSQLKLEDTGRGAYYMCVKQQPGLPVRDMLKDIAEEFLTGMSFPAKMRWPGARITFPRPIRWLLVKLGRTAVRFGFGNIKSGRSTRGHYLFADRKLTVGEVKDYSRLLKRNYVLAEYAERIEYLEKSIDRALKYISAVPVKNPALLKEINCSLEYPTAIRGRFPDKYLNMPRAVIEACLVHHQRFFPVEDKKGQLTNYFIGVRDGISEFLDPIRQGYERVLVARLEDADFFLRQDRKKSLGEHACGLKGIEFTRDLGTLEDKTNRCKGLSQLISEKLGRDNGFASRVAEIVRLGKADLTTSMVNEFPELEGTMGMIYAGMDGEDSRVANGIYQHYQPRNSEDDIPSLDEAAVAGAADRIDTLVGNFGAGVEASGSQDPYGMRRVCRGLLMILSGKGWDINVDDLIEADRNRFPRKFSKDNITRLKEFMEIQIKNFLEEKFRYDTVRCVMSGDNFNPHKLVMKASAVEKIRGTKGFDSLVTAFKRVNNILRQAEEKKIKIPEKYDGRRLKEPPEKKLSGKFKTAGADIGRLTAEGDYLSVLKILASMRAEIDEFFDKVMVMDPDRKLMQNRLALLKNIVDIFSPAGDISRLESSQS